MKENRNDSFIKHDCSKTEEIINNNELDLISSLKDNHEAKLYLKKRKLLFASNIIGYSDNFKEFVNNHSNIKYNNIPEDKRIILPFYNEEGKFIGCQGRSIEESPSIRYVTVKFYEDSNKIFGLNRIDWGKQIFIMEGPIDSLFIKNSIAVCQGDIPKIYLNKTPIVPIVVLDNEPRHKDTIKRMSNAIKNGYKVCFWKFESNLKDINDMILSGISSEVLRKHIISNSYQGIRAKLELVKWKRI